MFSGAVKDLPRLGDFAEYRPSPGEARNEGTSHLIGMTGVVVSHEPNAAGLVELDRVVIKFVGGVHLGAPRGQFIRRPDMTPAPPPAPVPEPPSPAAEKAMGILKDAAAGLATAMEGAAAAGLAEHPLRVLMAARHSVCEAIGALGGERPITPVMRWDEVEAPPPPAPEETPPAPPPEPPRAPATIPALIRSMPATFKPGQQKPQGRQPPKGAKPQGKTPPADPLDAPVPGGRDGEGG